MRPGSRYMIFISFLFLAASYFAVACNDNEFQCTGQPEKCLPTIWMCDGRNDCDDGSDEHSVACHQHSKAGQGCLGDQPDCVYLGVTRCIMHEWLCDGRTDCDNNFDEANCTHINVTSPAEKPLQNPRQIPSRMGPGVPLPVIMQKFEKKHNESTIGCQPFEFLCKSGECIIRDLLCDDTKDCPDGSDESEEKCATPPGLPIIEPAHPWPEEDTETSNSNPETTMYRGIPKGNSDISTTIGSIPNPEIKEAATEDQDLLTTDSKTEEPPTPEARPTPPNGLETMGPIKAVEEITAQSIEASSLGMPALIPLRGILGIPLPNAPNDAVETGAIQASEAKQDEEHLLSNMHYIIGPTEMKKKAEPIMPFIHFKEPETTEASIDPRPSVASLVPDESFGSQNAGDPLSINVVDETGVTTKIFLDEDLRPIIPINAPKNYKIMEPIHATIQKKVKIYTSNRLGLPTGTSEEKPEDPTPPSEEPGK